MSIEERFYKIIVSSLGVERDQINDETGPGDIPQWDSLGHQGLLTVLEKEFGFVFTILVVLLFVRIIYFSPPHILPYVGLMLFMSSILSLVVVPLTFFFVSVYLFRGDPHNRLLKKSSAMFNIGNQKYG